MNSASSFSIFDWHLNKRVFVHQMVQRMETSERVFVEQKTKKKWSYRKRSTEKKMQTRPLPRRKCAIFTQYFIICAQRYFSFAKILKFLRDWTFLFPSFISQQAKSNRSFLWFFFSLEMHGEKTLKYQHSRRMVLKRNLRQHYFVVFFLLLSLNHFKMVLYSVLCVYVCFLLLFQSINAMLCLLRSNVSFIQSATNRIFWSKRKQQSHIPIAFAIHTELSPNNPIHTNTHTQFFPFDWTVAIDLLKYLADIDMDMESTEYLLQFANSLLHFSICWFCVYSREIFLVKMVKKRRNKQLTNVLAQLKHKHVYIV